MCSGEGDWTCLQPGFPIRKSSDHSLVIDSPRLIADSYVLHRFLVPRHPPFALKNLATYKDARVHCVVLNIRAVPHRTPAPTPPPPPPHEEHADAERFDQTMKTRTGHPTQKGKAPTSEPEPSGPNNVPDTATPPAAFHDPRRNQYSPPATRRRQLIDVPPVSTRRRTSVHGQALNHHAASPRDSQCSLERR